MIAIIQSAEGKQHPFGDVPDNCETVRCPLGNCLRKEQICDGVVHCSDMADEKPELCKDRITMCDRFNSTHCQCNVNDLICANGQCLSKDKFCDGTNDCQDGVNTDEPDNCGSSCVVGLTTLHPTKLCNGNIDCAGRNDIGEDEGASLCCERLGFPPLALPGSTSFPFTNTGPLNNYHFRCVIGSLDPASASTNALAISDSCVPSSSVCDWDKNPSRPKCPNGADELDCISIWPEDHRTSTSSPRDPFGRYISRVKGYLYFVAYGEKYLYCASLFVWRPDIKLQYGNVVCQQEGYQGAIDVTLHVPRSRRRIMPSMELTPREQAHFEACQLVYITCKGKRKYYY